MRHGSHYATAPYVLDASLPIPAILSIYSRRYWRSPGIEKSTLPWPADSIKECRFDLWIALLSGDQNCEEQQRQAGHQGPWPLVRVSFV